LDACLGSDEYLTTGCSGERARSATRSTLCSDGRTSPRSLGRICLCSGERDGLCSERIDLRSGERARSADEPTTAELGATEPGADEPTTPETGAADR